MPCWQPRAVLFLEKVAPALEHVDSSSGAIGTAVNHAIAEFISIIARAPADVSGRAKWLERLRDADVADAIPYIETLGDFWGELCVTKELASLWADNLMEPLEETWRDHWTASYFQGTPVCLSSLLAAGRYQELLNLLEKAPSVWWEYRRWGVQALAAMGKRDEALRYAEASRDSNDNPERIARTCEEVLLSQGRWAEAYERYALASNRGTSNLASYRPIVRKYPEQDLSRILGDLVATTPGEEASGWLQPKRPAVSSWRRGLRISRRATPRAAHDFIEKNRQLALQAGLAAIRWLAEGYGFESSGADVWAAYSHSLKAAEQLGRRDEMRERIRTLVPNKGFVAPVLGRELGLPTP
jgi:tetratricopeptide (TPR) repeat protein